MRLPHQRCGSGQQAPPRSTAKTAKNQDSLDSPLISKLNEPVGQVSTHRPQRVQSGPIGIDIEADAIDHAGAPEVLDDSLKLDHGERLNKGGCGRR
jgi:hypothetical protein